MTRKERERKDTRGRIVEATLALAAKRGYSLTTTAEIARKAGVSEGIIYYYFKTKEDLFFSMIEEYTASFREQLMKEIQVQESPLKKLERLISFHFHFFTKEGSIFQVIFGKSGQTNVHLAKIFKKAILPYLDIVEGIIEDGMKEKIFEVKDPRIAALSLIGAMQFAIIVKFLGFINYKLEEAIENVKKTYLSGILRKHR